MRRGDISCHSVPIEHVYILLLYSRAFDLYDLRLVYLMEAFCFDIIALNGQRWKLT